MTTDWQSLYESGNTPWDRGSPAPGLVSWLESHQLQGRILAPGCGPGHDLTALASSGASTVVGIDIAPAAVSLASTRCASLPSVSVLLADLFTEAHSSLLNSFDWVFEHTCYCAIPPDLRPDYAAAVHAALRPGGHLLAIFYLEPWEAHEDQNQGPPFRTSRDDLDRMFQNHFTLVEAWQPTAAFPGREGREEMRILKRID